MDRKRIPPTLRCAALVAGSIGPMVAAVAQETSEPTVIDIEQLIVTGTRVPDRSATETAVPVDVVSGDALSNVGVTEINQALSVMLPSFNFPRPGLADGTDTIRPASLRGTLAGPHARADELEAPPCVVARERERHHRARRRGRRLEHDTGRYRAVDRGVARRRVGAVRIRRHRGRHQRSIEAGQRRRRRPGCLRSARLRLRHSGHRRACRRYVARTVLDRKQRHGRRDADGVRLEGVRFRRHGLPDDRRRV